MRVWKKIKYKITEMQKERYAKKKINEALKIIRVIY